MKTKIDAKLMDGERTVIAYCIAEEENGKVNDIYIDMIKA